MPGLAVRVTGLRELAKAAKQVDAELPRELQRGLKGIAEHTAQQGRANLEALGGVAEKAAPSVKAGATQRGAYVSLSKRQGFEMGAEFGSIRFEQFREWRGSGASAGYGLWPAIRAGRDDIGRQVEQIIEHVKRRAGL